MSVAVRSRLAKLEAVYDTTDLEVAQAYLRQVFAAPVFAPHLERLIAALLSRQPQYSFTVPEGSHFLTNHRGEEFIPCQESYLISWWNRRAGGPWVLRHYPGVDATLAAGEPVVRGYARHPRPSMPPPPAGVEPEQPEQPESKPATPEVSAYERLMAAALAEQVENGASEL